jgi:hypothetical protein
MLNNTTRRCPACGVILQQKSGNSGICPRCFREFCYTRESFHSRTVSNSQTSDMDRDTKIGLIFVGIFVSVYLIDFSHLSISSILSAKTV